MMRGAKEQEPVVREPSNVIHFSSQEKKNQEFKIACARVDRIGGAPDDHIRECIANSSKTKTIRLHDTVLITRLSAEPH